MSECIMCSPTVVGDPEVIGAMKRFAALTDRAR